MFSQFQVGFHKGWSCEDQITQIVQAIKDGFQHSPMKRSVLTLLDFRKAYHRVWREKILFHMLRTGIPLLFICWIQSFLNDHRACVPSSMSSVPVDALLKVYLKVLFLPLYCFSFTLMTWLLRLTTMWLLPSLLMTSPSLLGPQAAA